MSTRATRDEHAQAIDRNEHSALQESDSCPSCGRKHVIVFPFFRSSSNGDSEPKLACLHCCPEPSESAKANRVVDCAT